MAFLFFRANRILNTEWSVKQVLKLVKQGFRLNGFSKKCTGFFDTGEMFRLISKV